MEGGRRQESPLDEGTRGGHWWHAAVGLSMVSVADTGWQLRAAASQLRAWGMPGFPFRASASLWELTQGHENPRAGASGHSPAAPLLPSLLRDSVHVALGIFRCPDGFILFPTPVCQQRGASEGAERQQGVGQRRGR